jgi:hypothetical protein
MGGFGSGRIRVCEQGKELPMTTALPRYAAICATLLFGLATNQAARGEDFRIETRVYEGTKAEPLNSTTTLFLAGIVYDFPATPLGPWEITVFDPARGRFTLLDTKRKMRTDLQMTSIEEVVEAQRERASRGDSPFLKFLAHPEFEETYDEQTGELELESAFMTYTLTTETADSAEAMRQYSDFADGFTKLSPVLEAAAPPPFARLVVNQALRERGRIPDRVAMSARPDGTVGSKQEFLLRSEHDIKWKLQAADIARIEEVKNNIALFELVSFEEFRTREVEKSARK